jgi:hypothetical protein
MKNITGFTSRGTPKNDVRCALLQSATEREQITLWYEAPEMRYARFNYEPTRKAALLMPPVPEEPKFPAVSGRIAYCNGRYVSQPDTSVTYRRGRMVTTEWHALARIAA